FIVLVSFTMLTTSYALFSKRRLGLDVRHLGYMFAYVGLLGTAIQAGMIGKLSKLMGDKVVAITGMIIFMASMFTLPLCTTIEALVVGTTGIAVGYNLMLPTISALASKSVSAGWQGRVLGVMASSTSLGRIIGPILAGWLLGHDALGVLEHYGRTPLWTSGLIMLMALGLALTVRAERTRTAQLAKEEAI